MIDLYTQKIRIALKILSLILFAAIPLSSFAWVTTTIEANLTVTPPALHFGTVFPEQVLYKPMFVSLSHSFLNNAKLNDVEYHIEQSVKPRNPHDLDYCKNNPSDYSRCYPTLCPYISKSADHTPIVNDTSIPAFHDPAATTSIAYGRLTKSDHDTEDNWTIDLHVPCFKGQCAQDNVIPHRYELNPVLEHQILGCDLNVVVDKVSYNHEKCELEITKTVDKHAVHVGEAITYTLNFKNTGKANCAGGGVKIQDVLNPGLTYVSESHSHNVSAGYQGIPLYQHTNRTLTWNVPTLTPGQAGSVTLHATVSPKSCGNFDISNVGQISSTELGWVWINSNIIHTTGSKPCPHS